MTTTSATTATATATTATDVCIGYGADEHTVPADAISAATNWLCPACDARLTGTVRGHRTAPTAATCPAGGHDLGSRSATCLACYGD